MSTNPALQISVQPMSLEGSRYLFVVHNASQREVRNIEFSFYDVLGPGDFGLDDTHMPTSLTEEPKFIKEILAPGESTSLELNKWGPISRYRGSLARTIRGCFADGSAPNGHTLRHEVQVTIVPEPKLAK